MLFKKFLIISIVFLIGGFAYFVFFGSEISEKNETSELSLEKSYPLEEKLENHYPKAKTWGTQTGCGISVAELFFSFLGSDSEYFMTAYQIQIAHNKDFLYCPGENCLFDTGKETKIKETLECSGFNCQYSLPKKLPDAIYFWRVKVWDDKDVSSNWVQAILHLGR